MRERFRELSLPGRWRELPRRPRHRGFLATAPAVALAVVVVAVGIANDPTSATHRSKPNIVVIMTDDQDLRSLSVMRDTREALAQGGTAFSNYFVTYPSCCPSRATLLTGQYAHNHGVLSNKPPGGGFQAFDNSGTLGITLQAAGYRTGWIGKYLNGYGLYESNPGHVPRGWSEWFSPVHGTHRAYGYTVNVNGDLRTFGDRDSDYQTDVFGRQAASFIAQSSERRRPFFMVLSPVAPHKHGTDVRPAPRHEDRFESRPLPKPPSFDEADVSDKPRSIRRRDRITDEQERYLRELYQDRLASLLAVDDAVERVVTRLGREGELDNTVIMFTSDNGYLLGEHRWEGKEVFYEEASRVPLLLRGPGIPSGATRSQFARNVDLAPTILDLAGVAPRRLPDGRSLIPLVRDADTPGGRDMLLETDNTRGVLTRQHLYAEHPDGERELYDLESDPYQLESRHDDPSYETTEDLLRERLRQLEACAGASCP